MTSRSDPELIALTAGPLTCRLDRDTGRVVELRHKGDGVAFVDEATGPGGLEVYHERDRAWYSDLQTPATVESLEANADGPEELPVHRVGNELTIDPPLRWGPPPR